MLLMVVCITSSVGANASSFVFGIERNNFRLSQKGYSEKVHKVFEMHNCK